MNRNGVLTLLVQPSGPAVAEALVSTPFFSLPSFSAVDRREGGGINGALRGRYLQTQVRKTFLILSVVAATMFLLLSIYLCDRARSKGLLEARARLRRLSNAGEGERGRGKDEARGRSTPELCRMLEKAEDSSLAEFEGSLSPPEPPAASAEALLSPKEGQRPRKRKRKTKGLEEDTADATEATGKKKSRVELPPPPPPSVSSSVEEEDMNALIENLVTEALEASGPGVEEDWDFDFDEKEWLWTLSPATTSAAAESAKEEAQAHIELPPSTPNSSADEEEIDMVKAIEEAVAGALDEFGPDVADWDVEFAEEMLWVPINSPVTTTQEASSREEANQLKGPDKADKDLQHHFEASNLSSKDSDLGFSLKSERTLPMSAGPGTGEKPPRETESLNLEQAVPSTSKAADLSDSTPLTASSTSSTGFEHHKFYRLPLADAVEHDINFDGKRALEGGAIKRSHLAKKLLKLRELFAKDRIGRTEVNLLLITADELLNYAGRLHPDDVKGLNPLKVVTRFARRFLLADAIWCICKVVGPSMNKNSWWNQFISHLMLSEEVVTKFSPSSSHWPLVCRLQKAMEMFRQGIRPSAAEIVSLKRAIFCGPSTPFGVDGNSWRAWRKDDDEFERGSYQHNP